MNCAEVEELAGAYALRALPADEVADVESHLAGCTMGHPTLAELIEVVSLLPFAVDDVEPPTRLLPNLLNAALTAADSGELRDSDEPVQISALRPVSAAVPEGKRPHREGRRSASPAPVRRRFWQAPSIWTAAAVLALAVGLGAWNLSLQRRLDDRTSARDQQARALSALMSGAQVVPLASAAGLRLTLVRTADGNASLIANNLPVPAGGKVYEAWFIKDNKPVRAGVFSGSGVNVIPLQRPVEGAQVVAVTLEPAGGSDQPTSTPIASAPLS